MNIEIDYGIRFFVTRVQESPPIEWKLLITWKEDDWMKLMTKCHIALTLLCIINHSFIRIPYCRKGFFVISLCKEEEEEDLQRDKRK